jgi:hypothetical protein
MTQDSEFPFHQARRVTPEEHQHFKAMVAKQLGTQSDANTVINPIEPVRYNQEVRSIPSSLWKPPS